VPDGAVRDASGAGNAVGGASSCQLVDGLLVAAALTLQRRASGPSARPWC